MFIKKSLSHKEKDFFYSTPFASLQALSKKSQNHFCIATLCQSFLLYLPLLPSLPPLPPIIFPKKICTIQILVLLLPRLVKKDWSHSSVG